MPDSRDEMPPPPRHDPARAQRLLVLRASIKLLVTVGLLFLLLPFVMSLPWPRDEVPADATVVAVTGFTPGTTRQLALRDGSTVWVTRASPALAAQLRDRAAESLWYPSAPGLAEQAWFVLPAASALDEAVHFLAPAGAWPGGFVADSGATWDLAGRALKPSPGQPGGSTRKEANLLPQPWRERDDQLLLRPLPAPDPVSP